VAALLIGPAPATTTTGRSGLRKAFRLGTSLQAFQATKLLKTGCTIRVPLFAVAPP
jgi:hypothetical protein